MSVREKLQGDMLAQMRRYPQRGWIAGVCAGVSEHFGWNVKLVRLLLIIAGLCTRVFPLAIAYLVLWYLIDPAENSEKNGGSASTSPSNASSGTTATTSSGSALSPSALKARFSRLEKRLSSMEECVVSKDFELRQELRKLET